MEMHMYVHELHISLVTGNTRYASPFHSSSGIVPKTSMNFSSEPTRQMVRQPASDTRHHRPERPKPRLIIRGGFGAGHCRGYEWSKLQVVAMGLFRTSGMKWVLVFVCFHAALQSCICFVLGFLSHRFASSQCGHQRLCRGVNS